MDGKSSPKYSPLGIAEKSGESSKSLLSSAESSIADGESQKYYERTHSRLSNWRLAGLVFTGVIVVVLSFLLGLQMQPSWNEQCLDTQWSDLKRNVQYRPQTFDPRFEGPKSPYMGELTPEVDRLWYDLSKMFNYGVDYETLKRMNSTKAAAKCPGTTKYQVGLETFHQLHCLVRFLPVGFYNACQGAGTICVCWQEFLIDTSCRSHTLSINMS